MKLAHVRELAVHYAPSRKKRVKVGRLALRRREILFEYDAAFLANGLELSPFHLRLARGARVGPAALDGLFGVFDDSLPDGWGRLLLDRKAAELGLVAGELTALDRLAIVGARSMGALVYEPETSMEVPAIMKLSDLAKEIEVVLKGTRGADLTKLIAVGGSPKGARPKVLVQIAPNGAIHFGSEPDATFTSWLVKFRATNDEPHSAALEHAYCRMAAAAGIDVPRTQLLGATKKHAGYFAIERFDRRGEDRIHVHTLGGLLQIPHGYAALDYVELLKATTVLTRDQRAVAEMFRRACFNVFAHNRDDHTRNFAFLMDEAGRWRPSPAFDLTFAGGPGGEHTLLVAGEGRNPTASHLEALAAAVSLKNPRRIIDEVRAAVARFTEFADEARVPSAGSKPVAKRIAKLL